MLDSSNAVLLVVSVEDSVLMSKLRPNAPRIELKIDPPTSTPIPNDYRNTMLNENLHSFPAPKPCS